MLFTYKLVQGGQQSKYKRFCVNIDQSLACEERTKKNVDGLYTPTNGDFFGSEWERLIRPNHFALYVLSAIPYRNKTGYSIFHCL